MFTSTYVVIHKVAQKSPHHFLALFAPYYQETIGWIKKPWGICISTWCGVLTSCKIYDIF